MWESDHFVVVVSGVLAQSHACVPGQSDSTAKTVARLLEESGPDGFRSVRGKFSCIAYDKRRERLLILRSFSGQPLFYGLLNAGRGIVVATEIRQVLQAAGNSPEVDWDAVAEQLCFYRSVVGKAHTPYQGVSRCAATYVYEIRIRDGEAIDVRRGSPYWTPDVDGRYDGLDDVELAEQLRERLAQAVRRQVVGKQGVLALSGGMDSSSIWALMQELVSTGELGADDFRALSMVFPGLSCDESGYISDQERFHGIPAVRLDLSNLWAGQTVLEALALTDVQYEGAGYQLGAFMRRSRDMGAKAVVTGLGGDEWLSTGIGYLSDLVRRGEMLAALQIIFARRDSRRVQRSARLGVRVFRKAIARSLGIKARRVFPPVWAGVRSHRVYFEGVAESEAYELRYGAQRAEDQRVLWRWNTTGDEVPEQMAAAYGMEFLTPFMDEDLVDFCVALPGCARHVPGNDKPLLKQAMAEYLPETLMKRPVRTVFSTNRSNDLRFVESLGAPEAWSLVGANVVSPDALRSERGRLRMDQESPTWLTRVAWAEAFVRSIEKGDAWWRFVEAIERAYPVASGRTAC